jgi:hypothetical protein
VENYIEFRLYPKNAQTAFFGVEESAPNGDAAGSIFYGQILNPMV